MSIQYLHDKHILLSLAPEKMIVSQEYFPRGQKADKFEKLVTSFFTKTKLQYIIREFCFIYRVRITFEKNSPCDRIST